MRMHAEATVSFPRADVWRSYRDEIVSLVPYMPNIASIVVESREQPEPHTVKMKNVWRARSRIPAVAAPFLKEEMLAWDDYASWDERTWVCTWRTVTHFFKDRTRAQGTTTFVDQGTSTRLVLDGEFAVDLAGLPGVPRLAAKTLGHGVEKFIVALLEPNVASVARSLDQHLRARARSAAAP